MPSLRTASTLLSALVLASCQFVQPADPLITQEASPAPEAMRITTSFYPLAFLASSIAGPYATVTNLTPAGAEPHDYELTARDLIAVEQSDVLFLNGVNLEPWGPKVREQLNGADTKIVTVGEPLASRTLEKEGARIQDPHVWLDPLLVVAMTRTMTAALTEVDPSHADAYATQSAQLIEDLEALDARYREGLQTCARRTIVTSHAAFGYLADRYDLTTVTIAGLSPEEEPSARQLADITAYVREQGISTIFFEQLVSPRLAETIASETGATTLVLDPIEGLTDDEIRAGKSYWTQMEMNLEHLRQALECTSA